MFKFLFLEQSRTMRDLNSNREREGDHKVVTGLLKDDREIPA